MKFPIITTVNLSYYCIDGSTVIWTYDFLRNGVQAVSANGSFSTWDIVALEALQGSVLDLELFPPTYITSKKNQMKLYLYADKATVYRDLFH